MQTVIDGVLTNYLEIGAKGKSILVILPGWRHSTTHWHEFVKLLPEGVRTIVLDLPAFGSTSPLQGTPSVSEYAEFVHSFMLKLKLKKIALLGHSFGGQVAVDLAIRYPNDIEKLILVSPACVRSSKLSLKSKIAKFAKTWLPETARKYLLRFLASSDYLKSNETQRSVLNRILRVDYTDKLKEIKQNTFVIWGTEDKVIPNSSKLLAEEIQNSILIPLYGVDHNPHTSAPKKLLSALKKCLDY